MVEVVVVIVTSEEIDGAVIPSTMLRRLEFDTEQDVENWLYNARYSKLVHSESLVGA